MQRANSATPVGGYDNLLAIILLFIREVLQLKRDPKSVRDYDYLLAIIDGVLQLKGILWLGFDLSMVVLKSYLDVEFS